MEIKDQISALAKVFAVWKSAFVLWRQQIEAWRTKTDDRLDRAENLVEGIVLNNGEMLGISLVTAADLAALRQRVAELEARQTNTEHLLGTRPVSEEPEPEDLTEQQKLH